MKRRITALVTTAVMLMTAQPVTISAESDVFYDDFSDTVLSSDKWLIAEKNWGGTVKEDGKTVDYNGGVISENISVHDGNLVITGYGNQYDGNIRGINRDGSRRNDGKRCGGAIATRDYFGSGSYEIRAKIAPVLGCCSAMWTFEYEEDYSGDNLKVTNHEIDIEFPGRDSKDNIDLDYALCTTWITEENYITKSVNCGEQTDGEYHTYRFDWHTGSDTETPRVDYNFDGELAYTSYDYIPTNESRLWLGLWFPRYWAGNPDFDTTEFLIDYVKITPFHESGDTPQNETYPDSGWAEPVADIPKGWLLWHSYTSYSALDSKLYLRSPDGNITEISGDFINAMNGGFGVSPTQFTFMAIDKNADEWDIFLYDNGKITNLTQNSGFRNEDPKFSNGGKYIVFKRGKWDSSIDDFKYNLALLNIADGNVTMLTDDIYEEAMPYFSSDDQSLYYAEYVSGIGSIKKMNLITGKTETIFSEKGVNAYYPVVNGDKLYFTKWYSADNHCDQIVCCDGKNIKATEFSSDKYDCSDACPIDENTMIFSSTMNGEYDLYLYNEKNTARLNINTDKNELGADFFPQISGDANLDGVFNIADVIRLQRWLLNAPFNEIPYHQTADMDNNGVLTVLDLCMMKKQLKIV